MRKFGSRSAHADRLDDVGLDRFGDFFNVGGGDRLALVMFRVKLLQFRDELGHGHFALDLTRPVLVILRRAESHAANERIHSGSDRVALGDEVLHIRFRIDLNTVHTLRELAIAIRFRGVSCC